MQGSGNSRLHIGGVFLYSDHKKAAIKTHAREMVYSARFELATYRIEAHCSVQLSYEYILPNNVMSLIIWRLP